MSIQIALRLSEDVVAFIDAQVEAGRAKSRSDLVTRFVQRDRRRDRAARDVEILLAERRARQRAGAGEGLQDVDDLQALVAAASMTALDLD